MYLLVATIIFWIFAYISLFLPGYVLVKKLGWFREHSGIQLLLGYAVTLLLCTLLAVSTYALRLPPHLARLAGWVVLVVAAIEFVRSRYYRDIWALRFPMICLLVMSALSMLFLSLSFSGAYGFIPDSEPVAGAHYDTPNVKVLNLAHTRANDNYLPYRQAQFFVNRSDPARDSFFAEWGVSFFERTPLMGAVTAHYFTLLHDDVPVGYVWNHDTRDPDKTYLQFQVLASLLNNLFVIPAFFLLAKLFNKKTALITCLFLLVSQYFLFNTIFSWPKSLVAFFILGAWLLLVTDRRRSYTLTAGLLCGLAYLTHDLAILYIGATALYLLWNRRYMDIIRLAALPFVCAVGWLIVASKIYAQPSSFIYYPLSTTGLPPVDGRGVLHQFIHTNPLKIVAIRVFNLVYLLTPFQLLTSEGGQSLSVRVWALGLFSIPGAMGLGLLPAVLLALWKRLANWGFLILAIGPVVAESLFIGWPKGLGASHFAQATVVILSGLAVYYLVRLRTWWWLMTAYGISCVQYGYFIAYTYNFNAGAWFRRPLEGLILLVLLGVLIGAAWAMYRIYQNKKIQLLYN